MKKLLLTIMVISGVALGDGILMSPRSHRSFRNNTASENVPTSPSHLSTSQILSFVGNAQHLLICNETTSRIRVNWSHGSTEPNTLPASSVYNAIIPAAASGSYACFTADDVQLKSSIYIWSDGSAINSGLVYGSTW